MPADGGRLGGLAGGARPALRHRPARVPRPTPPGRADRGRSLTLSATIITAETHASFGWRPATGFGFARRTALVPLATAEVGRAARVMPVAFRLAAGRWQPVGVTGPVAGASLLVARDGRWRGSYVPAHLRVYPFCLDDGGDLALWPGYTPDPIGGDGVQPFFAGGAPTARLGQTLAFLRAVQAGVGMAHRPLALLDEVKALAPWSVPGIDRPLDDLVLTGLFRIDATAFRAIGDRMVLELFRADALGWLQAHLESLEHATRFRALAQDLVDPPIAAPRPEDRMQGAADLLAAIADDPGDAYP